MVCVHVKMKFSGQPLKRTPVGILVDENDSLLGPVATDRAGVACFDIERGSGRILVNGIERYHGSLQDEIVVELWNLTETGQGQDDAANPDTQGSNAYPGMATRSLQVNDHNVMTDSEGYLVDPGDWSEAFVRAQAAAEGLTLTGEHWEIIRFQRDWFASHGRQASVRDIIKHFRQAWGRDRGSNRYLHEIFPRGGPQKQGNRLAGLLRTKGEH